MKNVYRILVLLFVAGLLFCGKIVLAGEIDNGMGFKLNSLDNGTVAISDFRDKKPVLLVFWTTWCPYCIKQLIFLRDNQQDYKEIELLAINAGESEHKVRPFIKRSKIHYKVLLDVDNSVTGYFGIIGLPTYILIDKQGEVVAKSHAFPYEDSKKLMEK
ncbi:MAG: TlpA disulfide reductase family protein [Candidatus Omnitrophota bacterium]